MGDGLVECTIAFAGVSGCRGNGRQAGWGKYGTYFDTLTTAHLIAGDLGIGQRSGVGVLQRQEGGWGFISIGSGRGIPIPAHGKGHCHDFDVGLA
jgi:hypothetical protein